MNKSIHIIGEPGLNDLLRMPVGTIGFYKIVNYTNSQAQRSLKQKEITCNAKASVKKLLVTDPVTLETNLFMQVTVVKQGSEKLKRGRKLGGKNKPKVK